MSCSIIIITLTESIHFNKASPIGCMTLLKTLKNSFHNLPQFHFQGSPFGDSPGPENQFYVKLWNRVLIIYWGYTAFLSKNTFNNTGEKHKYNQFYGIACSFLN